VFPKIVNFLFWLLFWSFAKKTWVRKKSRSTCVFRLLSTKPQPPGVCVFITGGDHCHGPQRAALSGLWAIPSTGSDPQPLLVTYNLSYFALTPGEPTPYVCMYVSMVCGMYVGMCWVRRESTQVHREGGAVSSKGKTCYLLCDFVTVDFAVTLSSGH